MALSWLIYVYRGGIITKVQHFTDRELANQWLEHWQDQGFQTEIKTLGKK